MSLKKIFQVDVGCDTDTNIYQAQIYSMLDRSILVGNDKILRGLMSKVAKQVRKKELELKKFPLPQDSKMPEPSRIIVAGPNGN